jgi:hypothetical protein
MADPILLAKTADIELALLPPRQPARTHHRRDWDRQDGDDAGLRGVVLAYRVPASWPM